MTMTRRPYHLPNQKKYQTSHSHSLSEKRTRVAVVSFRTTIRHEKCFVCVGNGLGSSGAGSDGFWSQTWIVVVALLFLSFL